MRLFTYYRLCMLEKLKIRADGDSVLDVGCYDGDLISFQPARKKFAVDLDIQGKNDNVIYVEANGINLPFKDNIFDHVFAIEVVEHVEDEKRFISQLCRVTKPGGEIILTTPNKNIKLFPWFITNWVSKKWGHVKIGYTTDEISRMFPTKGYQMKSLKLRELCYRNFYIPLKFSWDIIYKISQNIAKSIIKIVIYFDCLFLEGEKGHLLFIIKKLT